MPSASNMLPPFPLLFFPLHGTIDVDRNKSIRASLWGETLQQLADLHAIDAVTIFALAQSSDIETYITPGALSIPNLGLSGMGRVVSYRSSVFDGRIFRREKT